MVPVLDELGACLDRVDEVLCRLSKGDKGGKGERFFRNISATDPMASVRALKDFKHNLELLFERLTKDVGPAIQDAAGRRAVTSNQDEVLLTFNLKVKFMANFGSDVRRVFLDYADAPSVLTKKLKRELCFRLESSRGFILGEAVLASGRLVPKDYYMVDEILWTTRDAYKD